MLAILLLTLAGLSIAVVNAMHNSLWSTYTVAATIPIAIIMGLYMQIWRKGDVLGASIIGVVLLALCILTGLMSPPILKHSAGSTSTRSPCPS